MINKKPGSAGFFIGCIQLEAVSPHDCMDAGGRVMHGAVTERRGGRRETNKNLSPQRRKGRKGRKEKIIIVNNFQPFAGFPFSLG
jgi:hypothetical protein